MGSLTILFLFGESKYPEEFSCPLAMDIKKGVGSCSDTAPSMPNWLCIFFRCPSREHSDPEKMVVAVTLVTR